MHIKTLYAVVLGSALLLQAPLAMAQQQAPQPQQQQQMSPEVKAMVDAAVNSANRFIQTLDAKNWALANNLLDPVFKKILADQKKSLDGVLLPFANSAGAVQSRNIVQVAPANQEITKGLQPGKYIVVSYRTAFAKIGPSIESVVLHEVANGQWAVLGYSSNVIPPQQAQPAAAPAK